MGDFVFADSYIIEPGPTQDYYHHFLRELVHKTNNLAGVIQGFASLALLENNLSRSMRENTEQMDRAARSWSALNKGILIAGGCSKIDTAKVELQDLFRFLEEKLDTICQDNGVTFEFHANPGLPPVWVDSSKFVDIFTELVLNAAEAAADSSSKTIRVELFPPGAATSTGRVDVFVRNPFPSVEPSRVARFYTPFFTTKSNGHHGLGLTSAAVLCGLMDVRLGMQSQSDQTTAWLTLPIDPVQT